MTIMFLAIIATSILGIIPAILAKNIIDIALPQGSAPSLIQNIRDLRAGMYRHLQKMSLKFFSNAKTGEITSRINNDINGIESMFSNTFIRILQGIFIFTTTAATLFYTNWILAIVTLMTLPLFVIPTRKVGKVRWNIASKTQAKLAELTNIITETLNAAHVPDGGNRIRNWVRFLSAGHSNAVHQKRCPPNAVAWADAPTLWAWTSARFRIRLWRAR